MRYLLEADFLQLAEEYSIEPPDTGFRPLASLEDLKNEAAELNTGEIFGPVITGRGYVIFKVLDKKRTDEVPGIKTEPGEELNNPFNSYITGLAKRYGISINEDILAEIKGTHVNAVVFKYLGFGGKIIAVPVIMPVAEWITEYQEETELNP
jgi:hypothetical protein